MGRPAKVFLAAALIAGIATTGAPPPRARPRRVSADASAARSGPRSPARSGIRSVAPSGAGSAAGPVASALTDRVRVVRSALAGSRGEIRRAAVAAPSGWQQGENMDPDARDPSLLRAHLVLLRTHPLLQRLPVSDDRVGISLLGQTAEGKPLLVVTYVGSPGRAHDEARRLLARLGDRAQGYRFSYRRVG